MRNLLLLSPIRTAKLLRRDLKFFERLEHNLLFKVIDVWKRISDSEAVRHRCFQSLQTGKFSVQSADFYRLPNDPSQSSELEQQHIELLIEQAPDQRSGAYETLEAAIKAHEAEFGSASDPAHR